MTVQNEFGGDDDLLRALRDPAFWATPVFLSAEEMNEIREAVETEDERGAGLCDALMVGPASAWLERFSRDAGARRPGVVRQLLVRAPALVERRPADAVQAASVAVAVAEALDPQAWPYHDIVALRGQALREHAYALSFVGRFKDALVCVERAERTFASANAATFDLARLALVKAIVVRLLGRGAEAIRLTREAAEIFLDLGQRKRYVNARMTEGAMLYDAGALEEALAVFEKIRGNPALDEVGDVRVQHNIATCLCDLGRQAEAVPPLEHCMAELSRLGILPERARSRWYLGNALLGTGRGREAVSMLRAAWRELSELGVTADAALAALDLAEALWANDQPREVPAICRQVIAQLTNAGLAARAMPALYLLQETAVKGEASRDLIRSTHATVRAVAREDARLFAQAQGVA